MYGNKHHINVIYKPNLMSVLVDILLWWICWGLRKVCCGMCDWVMDWLVGWLLCNFLRPLLWLLRLHAWTSLKAVKNEMEMGQSCLLRKKNQNVLFRLNGSLIKTHLELNRWVFTPRAWLMSSKLHLSESKVTCNLLQSTIHTHSLSLKSFGRANEQWCVQRRKR